MSKLTIVTFLKSWRGYGVGETAGFEASKADDLIKSDVAEAFNKGKKASGGNKSQTSPSGKSTQSVQENSEEVDETQDSNVNDDDAKP